MGDVVSLVGQGEAGEGQAAAAPAERQRKSRRTIEAEKRAAIAKEAGDRPAFDPGEVAELIELFWQNGTDRYFHRGPGGDWLEMSGPQLKVKLVSEGYWSAAMSPQKEAGMAPIHYMVSQVDQVMLWTRERRVVDYAMDVAGYSDGLHVMNGTRVLVRRGPRIIEPRQGEWETIDKLLEGMLVGVHEDRPEDGNGPATQVPIDQRPMLLAWLRVAYEAVVAQQRRPGQALILAGPAGCGKGRIQHFIITPLLGGRSADPSGYMWGRTDFNAELFGAEHLMMEDPASSDKRDDRLEFGERIKQFAVNDTHRYHPKGRDAVTLTPMWRVTISLNDDPDKIVVLPPLTPDILDKLILIRCFKAPMPMPTATLADRLAFARQIEAELPAFLFYLLNSDGILLGSDAERARFGCMAYQHPGLSEMLFDQSPAARLVQLLDQTEPWKVENGGDGEAWVGGAGALEEWMTNPDIPAVGPSRAHQARKLFRRVEVGRLLGRLEHDMPQRFMAKRLRLNGQAHTSRAWIVTPPFGRTAADYVTCATGGAREKTS